MKVRKQHSATCCGVNPLSMANDKRMTNANEKKRPPYKYIFDLLINNPTSCFPAKLLTHHEVVSINRATAKKTADTKNVVFTILPISALSISTIYFRLHFIQIKQCAESRYFTSLVCLSRIEKWLFSQFIRGLSAGTKCS